MMRTQPTTERLGATRCGKIMALKTIEPVNDVCHTAHLANS